jgi:hypothetical protein
VFLLYHLASNVEKQEKLYQEIHDVVGPKGKITEASLAQLKYLKVGPKGKITESSLAQPKYL